MTRRMTTTTTTTSTSTKWILQDLFPHGVRSFPSSESPHLYLITFVPLADCGTVENFFFLLLLPPLLNRFESDARKRP